MKRWILFFLITTWTLTGCNMNEKDSNTKPKPDKEVTGNLGQDPDVLVTNLHAPWSIQKNGDTMYVSERTGTIVEWDKGKMTRQKVNLKKTLSTKAEAGLLGFLLAPDFSKSRQAFAYYTYEEGGNSINRIVILEKNEDKWKEMETLIDRIPSGDFHHGGRIKSGPDGKLYATTGDARKPEIAQDTDSLGGKILRMNLDGTIPNDNPFANSYVYSYGHRNPQGLTWDEAGQMYESEHGDSAHDELNKIEPGKNYGWPVIQGDEKKTDMVNPLIHSGENTWAPSGMAYFDGKLYFAALRGEALKSYDVKSGNLANIITGSGRVRDVFVDEDYLYFISNNTDGRGNPDEKDDKLYRLPLSRLKGDMP
ncbi:PQQ-dependent sugar dehydrogenase [Peribacillus sp. NPDC097895]|uniref:PQQ-dependent sugar dehydrogenase n=1 Tax=Peribacillus sp. NPDC097895 TaxID=3390619 RepID=UPI003CFF93B5